MPSAVNNMPQPDMGPAMGAVESLYGRFTIKERRGAEFVQKTHNQAPDSLNRWTNSVLFEVYFPLKWTSLSRAEYGAKHGGKHGAKHGVRISVSFSDFQSKTSQLCVISLIFNRKLRI